MSKIIDLTGMKLERFTVIKRLTSKHPIMWECECKCGNRRNLSSANLRHDKPKSCGCSTSADIRAYNLRHGQAGKYKTTNTTTKEYNTWVGMRQRCTNKNDPCYDRYGGRGIKVCDRWKNSFEFFYKDMGASPSSKHSIDRINNDGHYEPDNCHWATPAEQNNNTSTMVRFPYKGKNLSIFEAMKETGNIEISKGDIWNRLNYGWNFERAVDTPVRRTRKILASRRSRD